MKRPVIMLLAAAVLILAACERAFDVTKVTIDAKGTPVKIWTSISDWSMEILDYSGVGVETPYYDKEQATYVIKYEWLKATMLEGATQVTFKADKNTTGRPRTLYFGGMNGNYYCSLKVEQSYE